MRRHFTLVALVIGCGPVVDAAADGESSSTTDATTPVAESSTAMPPPPDPDSGPIPDPPPDPESTSAPGPTTDDIDETTTDDDTYDDTSCLFLCEPDGGSTSHACDIWAQDCPDGEKCMPWANDVGNSWNATKCTPLDDAPAEVGDPCTVEGSGVSGIDDCGISAMCWAVDQKSNTGTCVGFCGGTEADPSCDTPGTGCAITNDGVLALCLPLCDPLLQDCAEGDACYPVNDGFFCVVDVSDELGAFGEQCAYINVCDPGLYCAPPETVPECYGTGCCTTYCDHTDVEASQMCPGAAGGQECIPWYEDGQAPPGFETLGVCAIPV